ncbi:MAG: hypothetical protein EXS58_01020 [Candidatus Latescibacteria bacterium]|nr:hypothetical protein [Candidatus Latescibacterota bacterium]
MPTLWARSAGTHPGGQQPSGPDHLRYLLDIDGETGRALTEELRRLATPEIYELLFEDRCYTYFHVVQFLYEFVKHHSSLPDRRYFAAGVGRGAGAGGGARPRGGQPGRIDDHRVAGFGR